MVDILRHMIATYGVGGLFTKDKDGNISITRSGIILIDEIDAHLHPEWQRKIGFWLKRHFPNIQFIVTTHSPIICQAADKKGLFHLPAPGSGKEPSQLSDEEYFKIIAAKPDKILLSPAFGLENSRSPLAVESSSFEYGATKRGELMISRAVYLKLKAKERATGKLSFAEKMQVKQLSLLAEMSRWRTGI
jgi:hypothetical protein